MAAAFMLVAAGCGSGRVTKPVSVDLQLDGKPFADAVVTFNPVSTKTGVSRAASGKADAAGRVKLMTYDPDDGAIPGEYKVTVQWVPPSLGQLSGEGGFEAMQKARLAPQAAPVSPVHENYTLVDKTPLKVTVPTSGTVTLNLKSDGT